MRFSLRILIITVAFTAHQASDASNPTEYVSSEVVEQSRLLAAAGTDEDRQKLRDLMKLYRSTSIYCDDLEDVFLPVFLSHSRSDLLQILVDERQGVLDGLQFGKEHSPWFVYQILTQKPLPEAAPAVARLLLATQHWKTEHRESLWKAYFAFATEQAPKLEVPLLTRIVRETESTDLAVFAIQRLSEKAAFDPEDVVAGRLARELVALRRLRVIRRLHRSVWKEIDACLAAFDLWQSRTGIELVVDEIRSLDTRPHAADLLLPRVAMHLTCGDQVRADPCRTNAAFVEWWEEHRTRVNWDPTHGRWAADRNWLLCGKALEQYRVVWDARDQRYLMYDHAAAAAVVRFFIGIKRYSAVIAVIALILILVQSVRLRRRRQVRNSKATA